MTGQQIRHSRGRPGFKPTEMWSPHERNLCPPLFAFATGGFCRVVVKKPGTERIRRLRGCALPSPCQNVALYLYCFEQCSFTEKLNWINV
jgi:hypothetical protein